MLRTSKDAFHERSTIALIKQGCCVFGIEDQRCVYSALRFTVFGHVLQILGEQVGSA